MFDVNEIAQKALQRVEQINKTKRYRRRSAVAITSTLFTCALCVLVMIPSNSEISMLETEQEVRNIIDPAVPLARPPTVLETICPDCKEEMEEDHCCCNPDEKDKQDEYCKECKTDKE